MDWLPIQGVFLPRAQSSWDWLRIHRHSYNAKVATEDELMNE